MRTPPPLTERVLQRLGGPRWLWAALWVSLAFISYEAAYRLTGLPTYPGLAYSILSSYANLIGLAGTASQWRFIRESEPSLDALTGDAVPRPFTLVGSMWGPLLLTAVATLLWPFLDFLRHPEITTAFMVVAQYVAWLPGNTGLWVYLVVIRDIYQMGNRQLHLRPFEVDRSLGLRPLGLVAARGILLVTMAIIPITTAAVRDARSFIALLIQYVAAVVLMLVALNCVRRQMLTAKADVLGRARALLAEALRPVTAEWSLEALRARAQEIAAAERVEQRAAAIQEWPGGRDHPHPHRRRPHRGGGNHRCAAHPLGLRTLAAGRSHPHVWPGGRSRSHIAARGTNARGQGKTSSVPPTPVPVAGRTRRHPRRNSS